MAKSSFDSVLKPIGEVLLHDKFRYSVPEHQRDYSWDKEVSEFWDDLIEFIDEDNYFLGSMVFQQNENDDEELYILDGQQRYATIIIMFSVIRDLAKDIDSKFSSGIHDNYIMVGLEEDKIEKLILNHTNKDIFLNFIQKEKGSGRKEFLDYEQEFKKSKSNRLIKNAYIFFEKVIREELKKKENNKEKVEYFKKLISLRKKFLIIKTIVGNDDDAYLLFETINERGLELSVSDLFKNRLLRESPQQKRPIVVETWKGISKSLDNKIRNFLKHYWHSKVGVVTERKLFGQFKNYIKKNNVNIMDFIDELKEEAEIYSMILQPSKYDWGDLKVVEYLEDIKQLGIQQVYPVLMIAKKKFDKKEFKNLLDWITIFIVRYIVICGRAENILETRFSKIARLIRGENLEENKKSVKDTNSLIQELKDLIPDNEEFKKKFFGFSTERNATAKYLLKKIDIHFTIPSERHDYPILTVEHILPENPDKEWRLFFKKKGIKEKNLDDYMDELKYRIGNLTILDMDLNKRAKNKLFTKKRDEFYKKSGLKINEKIKKIKEWNIKEIEKREKEFVKEIPKIWAI